MWYLYVIDRHGIICNAPLIPGRHSQAHFARGWDITLLQSFGILPFNKFEASPIFE